MPELQWFAGPAVWAQMIILDEGKEVRKNEDGETEVTRPGVLSRLIPLLKARGCQTMVVEKGVLDEEYFREYLHFYATTFAEHPPTATRLHFFGAEREVVEAALDPTSTPGATEAEVAPTSSVTEAIDYLGYCVLRPSSPSTVGEALLAIPRHIADEERYVHCATRFGQTLNGRRLQVESAPFIGQEQTGVCAHSAIWGAAKYLHKYRYYPKLSMPDIAVMASEAIPDTKFIRPADGLRASQMYSVFRQLGFQIDFTDTGMWRPDRNCLQETIYTLVESGLPALLGLAMYRYDDRLKDGVIDTYHAVWVTGHTTCRPAARLALPCQRLGPSETAPEYVSAADWASRFLVHDDNAGPYVAARIGREEKTLGGERTWMHTLTYDKYGPSQTWDATPYSRYDWQMVVLDVFAPLPEEVFVRPVEARRMAILPLLTPVMMRNLLDGFCEKGLVTEAEREAALAFTARLAARPTEFAFRTYLCPSARYQEHAVRSHMPPRLKELYAAEMSFPEYIWVTEICDAQSMGEPGPDALRVIGEVIVDSTDSTARDQMVRPEYMSMHVPGLIAYNLALTGSDPWRTRDEVMLWPEAVDPTSRYESYSANSAADDPPRSHRKLGPLRRLW